MTTRVYLWVSVCLVLAGCGDRIRRPTPEQLARFEAAGHARGPEGNGGPWGAAGPTIDMNRVLQAKIVPGPYRAVPGDVLHLEMPRFLEQSPAAAPPQDSRQTYNCRIAETGIIVLPIVGPVAVQGQSLAEIEATVGGQFYPRYVAAPLPVYVSVLEYKTEQVSIVGAVVQPGIHPLRHDQMTLVALLQQAGGIVPQGAAIIRINRATLAGGGIHPVGLPASGGHPEGIQMIFEREGPLRTTGWLRLEQEKGRTSARKWLDIGNQPQRREFLQGLEAPPGPVTDGLETKLVRLAAHLEEASPAGSLAAGWQVVESGRYVTAVNGADAPVPGSSFGSSPAQEHSLPTQTVATLQPLQRTGAVGSARGDAAPPVGRNRRTPSARKPVSRAAPSDGLGTLGTSPRTDVVVPDPVSSVPGQSIAPVPNGPPGQGPPENTPRPPGVETLILPVRGLNIPFADVSLQEGDTVVVEPPREQFISVVGLVRTPGNLPYPPGTQFNLIQAIAFAGGLDQVADPRYVSVYRLTPEGEIISITFQLVNPHLQQQLTRALAVSLLPGDVVSVENTPRTRTNVFLDRVFRITLGLYLTPDSFWNND